uniref:NADH-ubiquinone oxidoreductase chain 2 n=1 Tax=Eupteryx gracilirama TaxID=2879584 RepID=A0A8K1MFB7_9HEMI|nr:NADH dehydrogenase subunit 2 [Eupteryx gracilirama]
MNLNSSKLLFYSTMMMGIMMTISSNNWIMMWCGMEISLVSFIPLMISKSMMSSESSIKYFIVQSISSSMLMLGVMFMVMKGDYNYKYLMMTALLMKTGICPLHNWVLTVLEGLDFKMTFIMLSFNKIAPLTVLSYMMTSMSMSLVIFLTLILGSIMGLNQNSIKKLMGYSSIFNMGFILSIIKVNLMWMLYLTVYSMLLLMMTNLMINSNINLINQMMFSSSMIISLTLWINMLSMGGMPPFMGFSIKYMVMILLLQNKLNLMISFMLLSSLLVMFFYLRMTFVSSMNNFITNKIKLFYFKKMPMWIIVMNTMTLPMMLMVKICF